MFTQLQPETWSTFNEVYFASRATQIAFTLSGVRGTDRNSYIKGKAGSLGKVHSSTNTPAGVRIAGKPTELPCPLEGTRCGAAAQPQGWLRGPASVPGVLRALPHLPRGHGPGRVMPAGPGPAPLQKVGCKHGRGRAEMFAVGCPVPFGPRRERGLWAGVSEGAGIGAEPSSHGHHFLFLPVPPHFCNCTGCWGEVWNKINKFSLVLSVPALQISARTPEPRWGQVGGAACGSSVCPPVLQARLSGLRGLAWRGRFSSRLAIWAFRPRDGESAGAGRVPWRWGGVRRRRWGARLLSACQ